METKKNENRTASPGREKEKKERSPEQIRKRKMMIAVPIMLIPFCVAMYWIFFWESGEKANESLHGINVEIPEPHVAGIVDDKRKAYEQQEMQALQQSKMQSLEDYIARLKVGDKPTIADSIPIDARIEPPPPKSSIVHSAQAYREAARQVNSFYREPKVEKTAQMRELEKQVQELKASLDEQQENKTQRLDMMEKSYQMAAKYLGPKEEPKAVEQEAYSVAVGKTKEKTVSQLPQSPKEATDPQSRNYGFITAVGQRDESHVQNTIQACIHDDQVITDGARITLRLLEGMKAGSVYIPKNSLIFGTAHLQGERVSIQIPTIEYKQTIIPVELAVYDTDGQKGIFIPGSMGLTTSKEALGNMGTALGSSVSIAQSVEQQLVMDATKIGVQGVSQFLGKKFKEVKIHLKAGYQILLAPKKLDQ